MTEITNIPMPAHADDENPAEVGTAAWIAAHGGKDVTLAWQTADGEWAEAEDYGTWIGDVELDGTVYRLTLIEQANEITAEEVN